MASQVENATSHSAMKVVHRMRLCRLLFYVALEVKVTRLHCYRVRRLRNDIMLRKNKLRLTRLSLSASRSQLLRLSTCPTVPNVETPIDCQSFAQGYISDFWAQPYLVRLLHPYCSHFTLPAPP